MVTKNLSKSSKITDKYDKSNDSKIKNKYNKGSINNYKRKGLPLVGSGFIPMKKDSIQEANGKISKNIVEEENINSQNNKIINIIEYNKNNFNKSAKSNINKTVLYPNIFDSLFTIIKIKNTKIKILNKVEIVIKQNDISDILKPYLEYQKFEELLYYNIPRKTKNDFPKKWKSILSLNKIYHTFGFYKDYEFEKQDIGIIK